MAEYFSDNLERISSNLSATLSGEYNELEENIKNPSKMDDDQSIFLSQLEGLIEEYREVILNGKTEGYPCIDIFNENI